MVVLEDIDLVAQERTMMGMGATSLLFQLLNEMDGIGEDADVIFLMTTNRADLLEPALAARPGRVDQAVEFPLPDDEARARLIRLFGSGLELQLTDEAAVVAATEGVSPAFLRELVRKAALQAAVAGSEKVRGRSLPGGACPARERRCDHAGDARRGRRRGRTPAGPARLRGLP